MKITYINEAVKYNKRFNIHNTLFSARIYGLRRSERLKTKIKNDIEELDKEYKIK